jgi:5-methylcytosine-specific restriction protein A
MPWAIKGRCWKLGCNERATTGSYCTKHHQQREEETAARARIRAEEWKQHKIATDPEFKDRSGFYKTTAWKKLRKMKLAEEPLCRICGAAGRVVDHIQQISRGGLRYDMDNLQTLCSPCHDRKRVEETVAATGEKMERRLKGRRG